MRVCMLVYAFYEGDTRVLQYTSALAERGDEVEVIALRNDGKAARERLDGVEVFRIQPRVVNEKSPFTYLWRMLKFFFHAAWVLAKRHVRKPYQVVHVHNVPDFLVFAALVPKLLGARVILDIHDILPEFYTSKFGIPQKSFVFRMLVLTEKLSAAFANHVLIANHLWRERLTSRSVRPEKCTAICNYPDIRIFHPDRKARRQVRPRFLITYPGSLNTHQGLDIALRAFARVAGEIPDTDFHIYGEGPAKNELIALARELQLDGRVKFFPYVATNEIVKVMSRTDLAVVPKRASSPFGNEAASTKIMEFMALGVPVIVSRTRVDSFYHDSTMVKFFESENVAELAEAIVTLRRDAKLREELACNAARYIMRNNWQVKKQEYLHLVDSMTGQRPRLNQPIPIGPEIEVGVGRDAQPLVTRRARIS